MKLLKRLAAVSLLAFSSLTFLGCDPCTQACCLLCIAGAGGGGGGGQAVITPGASALSPQLQAVTEHASASSGSASAQRY